MRTLRKNIKVFARATAAAALEKARNASYADDAEKQAAVQNAAAALEAAEDALYSAQKAAEDANNAALSAAQSAEDNRNTALHTLEKEQETTENSTSVAENSACRLELYNSLWNSARPRTIKNCAAILTGDSCCHGIITKYLVLTFGFILHK